MADKKFTRKQVEELKNGTVFIIENQVFDVTPFLDEHPGGHEVLQKAHGTDATEEFHDVGHSLDARELRKKYLIGELVDEDKVEVKRRQVLFDEKIVDEPSFWSSWKFPVLLGVIATVLYSYVFG